MPLVKGWGCQYSRLFFCLFVWNPETITLKITVITRMFWKTKLEETSQVTRRSSNQFQKEIVLLQRLRCSGIQFHGAPQGQPLAFRAQQVHTGLHSKLFPGRKRSKTPQGMKEGSKFLFQGNSEIISSLKTAKCEKIKAICQQVILFTVCTSGQ